MRFDLLAMEDRSITTMSESRPPKCPLCNKVDLRTAKTDENGKAIHGDCYAMRMKATRYSVK